METFGYRNFSSRIKKFYPSFETFLNEAKQISSSLPKIPTDAVVKAKDGTMIDMRVIDKEMESAKTAIVAQSPLFAPYIHQFTAIYTWLVPTMATDGIRLFVNPKFAMELTWEQKIFVLIHEIMHCVLLHSDRIQSSGLNPSHFNMAADLEINPLIVDTIDHFSEEFVGILGGLYEQKYLGKSAEWIYRDIMGQGPPPTSALPDNRGMRGGEPGPEGPGGDPGPGGGGGKSEGGGGGGGKSKPQINVGTKVKIRATGDEGVVTAVNPDGTFEVGPITESLFPRFAEMIREGYAREEIIPIIETPRSKGGEPGGEAGGETGPGGGGESDQPDTRVEQEKKHDEDQVSGMSDSEYEAIYREMEDSDPAGTGAIISKKTGDKIAGKSGYDVEGGEAGDPYGDPVKIWDDLSGQLYNDMKSKEAGKGKGSGLLKRLSELHKSDVNWKSIFKRAVAKALSPEQQYRIPHKKHLGKPYVLRGLYQKHDTIKHIVVAVDVSGSMSDKTLERIINEINAMIFTKRVNKVTLVPFDGNVDEQNVQIVTRKGKAVIKEYRGPGGGTDFQSPLDWVAEKLKNNVSLMVLFTDGYAPMPKKPLYDSKFIWMVYDHPDFRVPFGQLVNLETKS